MLAGFHGAIYTIQVVVTGSTIEPSHSAAQDVKAKFLSFGNLVLYYGICV